MTTAVEVRMRIFSLDSPRTIWGDWSDALEYGFVDWDEETDTRSIVRSGPYTPPAYLYWDVLIFTQFIKNALEKSELTGISAFTHLKKTHIVNLDWKAWDTTRDITYHTELDGEPEDLITSLPHDESLAQHMPEYWLASIESVLSVHVDRSHSSTDPSDFLTILHADPTIDFFQGDEYTGHFVSQRAKEWLAHHCPGCFTFSLIPFAD
jgi:hypothetical protein